MKTKMIPMAGSQGVVIPASLIELTGLGGEVDVRAEGGTVVIGPARHPREGWDEAFKKAAAADPDGGMIDGDGMGLSKFDEEEWEW